MPEPTQAEKFFALGLSRTVEDVPDETEDINYDSISGPTEVSKDSFLSQASATYTVTVSNSGSVDLQETVQIFRNNIKQDSQKVTVPAGGSIDVDLDVTFFLMNEYKVSSGVEGNEVSIIVTVTQDPIFDT